VRRDSKSYYEDGQVNQLIPEPGRQKKAGSIQLAPPKEERFIKNLSMYSQSTMKNPSQERRNFIQRKKCFK